MAMMEMKYHSCGVRVQKQKDGWHYAVVLFVLLWVSFAFFHHADAGWNVRTRLALTYAIVEQGSLRIDGYHDRPELETNDKAFFEGHFYCDKAPGLSFVAVPVYWVIWQARLRLAPLGRVHSQDYGRWVFWTRYVIRVCTVGVAAASLGVLMWLVACRLGLSPRWSFVLALTLMSGTVLASYSVLFFSYLPSAACLFGAFALAWVAGVRAEWWVLFALGFLLGLSVVFEFIAALAAGLIFLWALYRMRPGLGRAFFIFLGGLIPVGLYGWYSLALFGEITVPYQYEYDDFFRESMAAGVQGVGLPSLSVLYYITVHPYRGFFYYAPFLLPGLFVMVRWMDSPRRGSGPELALCLVVLVAYLLFNAGYYMWWGGWAAEPRLLALAPPFFLPPLALWLRDGRDWHKGLFVILATVAVGWHLVILSVNPQEPTFHSEQTLMNAAVSQNLVSEIQARILPKFGMGRLGGNLGNLWLGLPGKWSLLPLFAVWLGAGVWLLWPLRKKPTLDPGRLHV